MLMSPELLGNILIGFILFVMVAGVWLTMRMASAEVRSEFTQQDEHMTLLEERIARIEAALFFGPSAVQSLPMPTSRQSPSHPGVAKRF